MLLKKDILGTVFNPKTRGYTILLSEPVKNGDSMIEQLEMRRVFVNDVLEAQRMPGGSADHELALFARLCSVDPAVIAKLDFADYTALQEVYGDFLASRREKFAKPVSPSPATQDGAGEQSD